MKRNTLIVGLAVLSFCVTAFGFINRDGNKMTEPKGNCSTPNYLVDDVLFMGESPKGPDLLYAVESRFLTRITKEDLFKAESIIDIVPKKATNGLDAYHEVRVAIIHDEGEVVEVGTGHQLNQKQKYLLRTIDYSTNIHISADCKIKNDISGEMIDYDLVYYMTVVPEREAEYVDGLNSIIEYLKAQSKEVTALISMDQLKPGQVSFTIDEHGGVQNIKLDSSCGYSEVDFRMKELLASLPGTWKPASDSKGNSVAQELVLFFGLRGC